MALNAKQRQKKLEKKKKKRQQNLAKKSPGVVLSKHKALSYVNFPVLECLVPSGLFETGIGTVVVARQAPQGMIALSAFVVDVFCLGVKNALFRVVDGDDYDSQFIPQVMASHEGQTFDKVSLACAYKLIDGAIAYAQALGFYAHPDYKNASNIFGDVDVDSCEIEYTYGSDGKPYYMRGPYESINTANNIVRRLQEKCGEDGFHFMIMDNEY